MVLLLISICWWLKDRHTQPFYGIQKVTTYKPYFIMLLYMLPLIALAAFQPDFKAMYPRAQLLQAIPDSHWGHYLVFEGCYGIDFVSIEFFSVGF